MSILDEKYDDVRILNSESVQGKIVVEVWFLDDRFFIHAFIGIARNTNIYYYVLDENDALLLAQHFGLKRVSVKHQDLIIDSTGDLDADMEKFICVCVEGG